MTLSTKGVRTATSEFGSYTIKVSKIPGSSIYVTFSSDKVQPPPTPLTLILTEEGNLIESAAKCDSGNILDLDDISLKLEKNAAEVGLKIYDVRNGVPYVDEMISEVADNLKQVDKRKKLNPQTVKHKTYYLHTEDIGDGKIRTTLKSK